MAATQAHWAAAVLYNGLARYQEAASAARQATSNTFEPWISMWALPELVEAAARVGDTELARDALERLAETTQPCGTEFALGIDAREQLHTAHDLLAAIGMEAFAERARIELLATGETARRRTVETSGELTAQEALIARLARDGLSNPEIGSRLFISARTVKYHLGKVFTKLDISSRAQLDRALPSDPATAQAE